MAHYVIVPPESGKVTRVEFSPAFPDYAVVLYEDRPPVLYDVRTKLPDAVRRTVVTEELRPLLLNEELAVPIRFQTPACAAAFRRYPGGDRAEEVAFAFGEGDTAVHRFGLKSRRMRPPVEVEEPIALAYSGCGNRLVVGGKNSLLALYDVQESPLLVNSARGEGEVIGVDINYRNFAFGMTDRSLIFGFGAKATESQSFHFRDEDGENSHETIWSALVCDPFSSLMFAATDSGRFWLARTESFDGASCDSIPGSRIIGAQFLEDNFLLVASEAGVVLHQYTRDDDGRITSMGNGDIYSLDNDKARVVGARHYTYGSYRCVCIALTLS